MSYELHLGDCREVMAAMPANSVDSIVCDPPYGLSFMGKDWDHGVPGVPFWEAALRVAKPGAMLLAFGGTRTFHRLTVAIEDAGWEIKDCLMWLYASGMPKGIAVDKAIDKHFGKEREVVGPKLGPDGQPYSQMRHMKPGTMHDGYDRPCKHDEEWRNRTNMETAPATPEAAQWQGWHSALKPSWEPVIMAQKPVDKTYANNALVHGVAGLNVDGCRIDTNGEKIGTRSTGGFTAKNGIYHGDDRYEVRDRDYDATQGRWPSNVLLDEAAAALLDEQSGERPTGKPTAGSTPSTANAYGQYAQRSLNGGGDTGGASRYFQVIKDEEQLRFAYVAKASASERNEGLQGMEELYKMRDDLTSEQREYVTAELQRLGLA